MIEILKGTHETVNFDGVRGVKVYRNVEVENYPAHWHNAVEIICPISNSYAVETAGLRLELSEGDVFVSPPGELHSLFAPDHGQRLIIQIDNSLLCNLIGMDALLQMLRPYKLVKRESNPELAALLGGMLEEICLEYTGNKPFRECCMYTHFISFFVTLGRSRINAESIFPNITPGKQQEYCEKFMSICSYINDHCTENLTVEQLSKKAGFSKFHFCRLFKQFTDTSFYNYLLGRRMAYVETLLSNPNLPVTHAAMQAGFNSISSFNRIFHQYKQCSPTEYRAFLWKS